MRSRFYLSLLLSLAATLLAVTAAADEKRIEPLPIEQAFRFEARMDDDEVLVRYTMPSGLYIYRNKILLRSDNPQVVLGTPHLPEGETIEDPLFGRSTVYYEALTVSAPVSGSGAFNLIVHFQGCDEETGVCYPPSSNSVALLANADGVGGGVGGGQDEAAGLTQSLKDNSLLWNMLVFYLLGLGLSLTPCVLPMVPILLGIIGGRQTDGGSRGAARLTFSYIAGVVLVFTAAGIIAARSGQHFAAQVQMPPVIIFTAAVFVALALSLFGAFELRMPAAFHRYYDRAGKQGGALGAFALGALSVIVVSPCISAPLVGALVYIAQTGNTAIGGASLFSLSLGMCTMLAAVGLLGRRAMPATGEWMEKVKILLGLLLLAVAVWTAATLIPTALQFLLYGFLLIVAGLLGAPFTLPPSVRVLPYLVKAASVLLLLTGAALSIHAINQTLPAAPSARLADTGAVTQSAAPQFTTVTSLAALEREIASANAPVLVDFYADWCVSCKELEYLTFTDARVASVLEGFHKVRVDVTDTTPASKALLQRYELFGPPAIFFYDTTGQRIPGVRVVGFQNAERFLETLDYVRAAMAATGKQAGLVSRSR